MGSLKSEVSFAKEPYKRDDILQKGERQKEATLAKAMGKEIKWLMGWLQLVGSIKL